LAAPIRTLASRLLNRAFIKSNDGVGIRAEPPARSRHFGF
jgi:hypothetical protein